MPLIGVFRRAVRRAVDLAEQGGKIRLVIGLDLLFGQAQDRIEGKRLSQHLGQRLIDRRAQIDTQDFRADGLAERFDCNFGCRGHWFVPCP